MANVIMVIELLSLIAAAVPKLAPQIASILLLLKGEPVEDISLEELNLRVDAAIAKLPPWE